MTLMATATVLSPLDTAISAPDLPDGLDTPCAVVDLDRLERNIARMQARADVGGRGPPATCQDPQERPGGGAPARGRALAG